MFGIYVVLPVADIRMIKSREMGYVGHMKVIMPGKINAYKVLVGKLEGNRSLGRHMRRQEHSFKWIIME
jgi:hypothetical protein